ncbi:MAG: hypothetical protein QXD73_04410 [Candidatus Bathyarchaeia archaeon]
MGGVHVETLTRFLSAFKGSLLLGGRTEALTTKDIQQRTGLNRTVTFRVIRHGLKIGIIGKTGKTKSAKYYLKWPETVKSPKPSKTLWETFAMQAWLKQNIEKIRKFAELPDWFMEIREALLAFDARERGKIHTNAFAVQVDAVRQLKREIGFADKLAVQHALHPAPLDDATLAWKEEEDFRILKWIRENDKNVFP